jgi:DNA replication licensing factor MCM5
MLAKHVINVHRKKAIAAVPGESIISSEKLKKYVAYARQHHKPRLSKEAAEVLKNRYVTMRNMMAQRKKELGKTVIPITVRQLEAIIRLSESLAKMELADQANVDHVKEALRLFQVSTLYAATANFGGEGVGTAEFQEQIKDAERYLVNRISIGMTVSYERIKLQMIEKKIAPENAIIKAINVMAARGSLVFKNMRKQIVRERA